MLFVDPTGEDGQSGSNSEPLRTITEAQRRVRDWIAAGLDEDVQVILRKGVYELDQPLVFGVDDSPPNGLVITYKSAPNETVVLSGGRALSDWHFDEGAVWVHRQSDDGQIRPISLGLRQLFIDDQRIVRAGTQPGLFSYR